MHDGTGLTDRPWGGKTADEVVVEGLMSEGMRGVGGQEAVLLALRGVRDAASARRFYDCPLSTIGSPRGLKGIERAAEEIRRAAASGWSVGVMGDYDVDGVMSAAILGRVCTAAGCRKVDVFLPDRRKDGYGLNDKTLVSLAERWASSGVPDLFVVADSGTSSRRQVDDLRSHGVRSVVVIDHHIPSSHDEIPSADVLVNWRLSGYDQMCAAGECYLLAMEVMGGFAESCLCYAAIATVADMVPVEGVNRPIVKHGLGKVFESNSYGLQNLFMRVCKGSMSQSDVAFKVAPRINSVGRMAHADEALALLVASDNRSVADLLSRMEDLNRRRKAVQADMESQAVAAAEASGLSNGLLLVDGRWDASVCGVACNELVEMYAVPCIMLSSAGGRVKGSGRSPAGVSVKAIMDRCAHIFSRYGGHDAACGAELKPEFVKDAPRVFDDACAVHYLQFGRPDRTIWFDAVVESASDLTVENAAYLHRTFHPYSEHNPEPKFLVPLATVSGKEVSEGETYMRTSFDATTPDGCTCRVSTFSERLPAFKDGDDVRMLVRYPQTDGDGDGECGEWTRASSRGFSMDLSELRRLGSV